MGLGEQIVRFIERRREKALRSCRSPLGDFFRAGGEDLLYDLPVATEGVVMDGGGYRGDWSARMSVRYGCRCEIYEPVAGLASACAERFRANGRVRVHAAALGKANGQCRLRLSNDGSSAFTAVGDGSYQDAEVRDIGDVVGKLDCRTVDAMKLNIEGAEYDVLERVIELGIADRFTSLLIQFHRQPDDWQSRMRGIRERLSETHDCQWRYDLVWEKWLLKESHAGARR